MSLQQLSISNIKVHYQTLFDSFSAVQQEHFPQFLRQVVKDLSYGLNINVDLMTEVFNDRVVCNACHLGALEALNRVLPTIAETANYKATNHPDWSLLAGRIEIEHLKLQVPETFDEMLDRNPDIWRSDEQDYYSFAKSHAKQLEAMIVPERDHDLYFFGVRTLKKSYLLRIIEQGEHFLETPQRMYLRIAAYLWMPNLDMIKKYYDLMSTGKFTHASPTMFNSGIRKGSLASCFLLTMQDDLRGIFNRLGDCAEISKSAGGIGLDITPIRHSTVGHLGQSSGIVPMLKVFDATMRYVDQAGRRKGSAAIFLQPWHIDFEDFLLLKRQHGKEERRARDLFYSVWNCDIFMERVKADEQWTLFCPKYAPKLVNAYGEEFNKWYRHYEQTLPQQPGSKNYTKTVAARDLWNTILHSQVETGMPFMTNKDTANYTSNQKNLGLIRSSNLCVSGDTYVLTKTGQHKIRDIVDRKVDVWNGEEWSEVDIVCTSVTPQKLLTINFSNGTSLKCTPEHKFYVQELCSNRIVEMRAHELKSADRLIMLNLPPATDFDHDTEQDFVYPYTHGFFSSYGTYDDNGKPCVRLYGNKRQLLGSLNVQRTTTVLGQTEFTDAWLPTDIPQKGLLPMNASIENKLQWFAGYADACGVIVDNDSATVLKLMDHNKEFLGKVQLMLQTLGIDSDVVQCTANIYGLLIDSYYLDNLCRAGLQLEYVQYTPTAEASQPKHFVYVKDITTNELLEPTFCFTEPKRHMGVFNGVLTGQCQEIMEVTDQDTISSCNLASIALDEYVDIVNGVPQYNFAKLGEIVRLVVRGLNHVIDRTHYPLQQHDKAGNITDQGPIKTANLKYRPLGLGVQALADAFLKMNLAWTDPEAKKLNQEIFATIYYHAIDESIELAKEYGVYEGFHGSPASKGLLKPDLIARERARKQLNKRKIDYTEEQLAAETAKFLERDLSTSYDWDSLRTKVQDYGLRNSLLVALMPTASSAQIRYKNESFEPFTSNLYVRSVLAGNHIVINRYMVKDLEEMGMWNKSIVNFIIKNEGSIAKLPENLVSDDKKPQLQRLKEKYATAFELSQRLIVDMSIDRAYYVCQSQSLNIYSKNPSYKMLTSLHFHAWEHGLSTGMYYLRTKPATEAVKFTVDGDIDLKNTQVLCTDEVCVACQS